MSQTLTHKESKLKNTVNSTSAFKPVTVQKKMSVGASNDSYEVEAVNMANRVMSMNAPSKMNINPTGSLVQRKCTACEQEEKIQKKSLAATITPLIQRSSREKGGEASSDVENKINSSKGNGNTIDGETKNFMETRFGTDFSDIKIHTGSQAVEMSRELNAQAFTVGNDIYFNEGKYNPNSDSGKHLLAHELTHTVQQKDSAKRKVQRSLCIKSVFGGEVKFNNLTTSELSNIAVINEDDFAGITTPPVNNRWYNCDGFWYNGFSDWFKIPDHCKVEVNASPRARRGFFSSCCNWAASLIKNGPNWSSDGLDSTKSNPF